MGRSATKAERIEQMIWMYSQRAYTDIEMAEALGVERSTIWRDRTEMALTNHLYEETPGRWRIDRDQYISNIKVNLHEGLALYLAARRASRQTRIAQPHVARGLEKLAAALRQPMTERLASAAARILEAAAQPERVHIVEQVAQGWAEHRKVAITYTGLHARRPNDYLISPFLIEPSMWSDGAYVIGPAEGGPFAGKASTSPSILTFKIERIEAARATLQSFAIPNDFDEDELLRYAWGIWTADAQPVTVRLRFAPGEAARRVRESIWHPTQKLDELEDGGCIWTAQVAEWHEMLPWVRGWGADCEVLAPEGLRQALVREARELGRLYLMDHPSNDLIAHLREKDRKIQTLWEHLTETSELAGRFAAKIGLHEAGKALGLLHDLGKASEEFQNYLRSATGLIDTDADTYIDAEDKKGKIDHSSAGAQLVYRTLNEIENGGSLAAQVLSLCLASHHSGLIDCLTPDGKNNYMRRMKEKPEEQCHTNEALAKLSDQERETIQTLLADETLIQSLVNKMQFLKEAGDSQDTYFFKIGLLIRYLFSCLIDADRLNTADFEVQSNTRIRNEGQYQPWNILIQRLDARLNEFVEKAHKNDVYELRSQVSQACFDFSSKPRGVYQLTVPTGGGKTLSSLRFALNHAQHYDMDHVFYVIPYTSIIDQNAQEIRKILEDKDEAGRYLDRVVLEHHSNLTPEEESRRQRLLAENWDAPVVLTTQVQFLETLFGSGTRGARRLHQLANSVIIFDEIQTLPMNCIHLFNLAIRFLVHGCGSTVVLCTATQPPLDQIEHAYRALILSPDQKIIDNEKELFEKLKRVEVFDRRRSEGWNEDQVADLIEQELEETGSVLAVVNTRKSALRLYQTVAARQMAQCYHLSTNMCPAHRLEVLEAVKECLPNGKNEQPVVCISTQLIEAGVDIDFGSVIRYLAGLDRIAQAAGRCNRHGTRPVGRVHIINPAGENLDRLIDIRTGMENARRVLDDFKSAPQVFEMNQIGLEAMAAYFNYYYYAHKDEMRYKVGSDSPVGREDDLFNLLSSNTASVAAYRRINGELPRLPFKQSFHSASRAFRVIDSAGFGVIVPYGVEGPEIVNDLCAAYELEKQFRLLKRAQRYAVNLYPYQFQALIEKGAIQEAQKGAGVYYLDQQYYSDCFGWSDEPVNDLDTLIC